MSKAKTTKIKDNYIREVSVNYRTTADERIKIKDARQVADFVRSVLTDNSREHCIALYLDSANQIASYSIVSIGGANSAPLAPREVFQRAVLVGAISIILSHNHPSGSLTPSDADRILTISMKKAGEVLGIEILDHVIVTDHGYISLREEGAVW